MIFLLAAAESITLLPDADLATSTVVSSRALEILVKPEPEWPILNGHGARQNLFAKFLPSSIFSDLPIDPIDGTIDGLRPLC